MTKEDEQVKKFIVLLDDDNALDEILGIMKNEYRTSVKDKTLPLNVGVM